MPNEPDFSLAAAIHRHNERVLTRAGDEPALFTWSTVKSQRKAGYRAGLLAGASTVAALAGLAMVLACLLGGCATPGAPIREQDELHQPFKPGWVITIAGVIYVPKGTIELYTKEPISAGAAAVVVHERIHAAHQVKLGSVEWSVLYFIDAAFRWSEERLAYEAEIAELIRRGGSTNSRGAAMNMALQTTPAAPNNGDHWYDTTQQALSHRVGATTANSITQQLSGTVATITSQPNFNNTLTETTFFGTLVSP